MYLPVRDMCISDRSSTEEVSTVLTEGLYLVERLTKWIVMLTYASLK